MARSPTKPIRSRVNPCQIRYVCYTLEHPIWVDRYRSVDVICVLMRQRIKSNVSAIIPRSDYTIEQFLNEYSLFLGNNLVNKVGPFPSAHDA